MYQPMLFLHWKQIRFGLIPFILAAFSLPLLTVQGLGMPLWADSASLDAYRIVSQNQDFLMFYPLLALGVGITLALSAWNWDHQLKHVYALSLPVSRMEYTMLKMGAGAALALLPVAGLWLGAHLATMTIALPEGIHAYPNQLATRFALAVLVSYAALFAMAAGTMRTTIYIVSAVIAFFVVGGTSTEFLANYFTVFESRSFLQWAVELLASAPGPFEIFTGSWTLIDV